MPEPQEQDIMKIPEEIFNRYDDKFNVIDGSDKEVPANANSETPPEKIEKTEKKVDEPPKKEQPEKTEKPVEKKKDGDEEESEPTPPDESTVDEDEELSLDEKIQEILQSYDTDEKKQQLLEDLPNHEKFFASNTKKAQKLAEQEKELGKQREKLDTMLSELTSEKLDEALADITSDESLDDLLDQTDEWYADKDSNPLRTILETLTSQSVDSARALKSDFDALAEEKALVELEKEVVHVQGIDSRYKDEEELSKLAETAEQFNTNLETAHKILVGEEATDKFKTYDDKIKKLQDDLKSRNKEIKKLNLKLKNLIENN